MVEFETWTPLIVPTPSHYHVATHQEARIIFPDVRNALNVMTSVGDSATNGTRQLGLPLGLTIAYWVIGNILVILIVWFHCRHMADETSDKG